MSFEFGAFINEKKVPFGAFAPAFAPAFALAFFFSSSLLELYTNII
jgi:hypothetical protein